MTTAHTEGSTNEPSTLEHEQVRHVRLRVPDSLYRALRHRLVDRGPETSISDLIVELIESAVEFDR